MNKTGKAKKQKGKKKKAKATKKSVTHAIRKQARRPTEVSRPANTGRSKKPAQGHAPSWQAEEPDPLRGIGDEFPEREDSELLREPQASHFLEGEGNEE